MFSEICAILLYFLGLKGNSHKNINYSSVFQMPSNSSDNKIHLFCFISWTASKIKQNNAMRSPVSPGPEESLMKIISLIVLYFLGFKGEQTNRCTCLKNSSNSKPVQRSWRSQSLAGWLMSAQCNTNDKTLDFSMLQVHSSHTVSLRTNYSESMTS